MTTAIRHKQILKAWNEFVDGRDLSTDEEFDAAMDAIREAVPGVLTEEIVEVAKLIIEEEDQKELRARHERAREIVERVIAEGVVIRIGDGRIIEPEFATVEQLYAATRQSNSPQAMAMIRDRLRAAMRRRQIGEGGQQ
jgi:hypothetical protein